MVRHGDGSVHFLPWQEEGRAVAADCPPCQADSVSIARQRLRLPGYFSKRWTVDRVINELEEADVKPQKAETASAPQQSIINQMSLF